MLIDLIKPFIFGLQRHPHGDYISNSIFPQYHISHISILNYSIFNSMCKT